MINKHAKHFFGKKSLNAPTVKLLLEMAPKIQNNSKFTKEQEMFENWTTDGVKHQ